MNGSSKWIVISDEFEVRLRDFARTIVRTPFTRRTWQELSFFLAGAALAVAGFAFVVLTMAAGVVLAVTFLGLAVIGLSLRGARGIGDPRAVARPGACSTRRSRTRPLRRPGRGSSAGSSRRCATAPVGERSPTWS